MSFNIRERVAPYCSTRSPYRQPWPLIDWGIFLFSSENTDRNLTKLDRNQDLNTSTKFVFSDLSKKQDGGSGLWFGKHVWFLLWNRWSESKKTWQDTSCWYPLPKLCFSGRLEKQDGHPCLWLAETFSTSSLKPLNWIQWHLTGNKVSTSSTKFMSGQSVKQDGHSGFWYAETFLVLPCNH